MEIGKLPMDDDIEQLQDQELAAFTDALLAGQAAEGSDLPPLAQTVRALAQTISPQLPPERLRRKIERQIVVEWAKRQLTPTERVLQWFKLPARQWAWAGVAAVAVAAVAIALLAPAGAETLTGTAIGDKGTTVIAILGLAGVLVMGWLAFRKK